MGLPRLAVLFDAEPMAQPEPLAVASTDKTTNLNVAVTGELPVDAMEAVLSELATALGMHISHITTLGTKRYPGNRHWHFKLDRSARGCLDVTYWPEGRAMWISMRNYEPDWVHELGPQLGADLERRLANTG